jgi:hypothetical protein
MWSMRNPARTGLIWAGAPLVALIMTVGLSALGDWLILHGPDRETVSPTAETLIALPGALAGAIFVVSLFVVPTYVARAWRGWRQIRRLREPGSASPIARWTVNAPTWRQFQSDLLDAWGRDGRHGLSKMALSLCDLDAPTAGVEICVGEEGVQVGAQYFALRGGRSAHLTEVAAGDLGRGASRSGADYLAFVSTFEGYSRSLGAYRVEEIGLLIPVPPLARAAMRGTIDHFTPEAIAALQARDARLGRIGCLLNLSLLAVSVAMIATFAVFDVQQAGWYGLLLFMIWAAWLVFYLIQFLIVLIAGFGHMIRMVRTPR